MIDALRVHPRVAQQGLGESYEQRERLFTALPRVVPFAGRPPHKLIAILDWDHRLPSRQLTLRLHAVYDAKSDGKFELTYAARLEEITRRNLFPEFDLPDFAELAADESYEAELTPELSVESMRLVSPWRRRVQKELATAAVRAVRESEAFTQVRATDPSRPAHLGDLEAVGWMPPCESGHLRWTIDVWWLTAFDGRIGRGWSFLVDNEADNQLVSHREFTIRSG